MASGTTASMWTYGSFLPCPPLWGNPVLLPEKGKVGEGPACSLPLTLRTRRGKEELPSEMTALGKALGKCLVTVPGMEWALDPSARALSNTLCQSCSWASTLLELSWPRRAGPALVSLVHTNQITYFEVCPLGPGGHAVWAGLQQDSDRRRRGQRAVW